MTQPTDLQHVAGFGEAAVPLDYLAVTSSRDDVTRLVDHQGEHSTLVGSLDGTRYLVTAWGKKYIEIDMNIAEKYTGYS